ncbi:MAG: S1C family serine protease [Myxococcota bacterium]
MLARTLPLVLLLACKADAQSPPAAVAPPASFNPAMSLAPLVDAVEPAVVNVYTSVTQRVPRAYQYWFNLPESFTQQGQGSGFAISADGYIITNNHVVRDATGIKVKFPNGKDRDAKVVGADPATDVALLKIESDGTVPYLKLGKSDAVRVGDWVVAIGNPLGLGHTVTAGIVSGKGRDIPELPFEEFIQTDASINPGNSGGPLVALDGTVIGMNTAIIQGANTVGFAIPSDHISSILPQLREKGKVARGALGIQMADVPEAAQKALGKGVLVEAVAPEGGAAKAGLRPGDMITAIDGKAIADNRDLLKVVSAHAPGDEVEVTIVREGKEKKIKVKLGERQAS